jgi:hypothetical protein
MCPPPVAPENRSEDESKPDVEHDLIDCTHMGERRSSTRPVMGGEFWPSAVISAFSVIDNPWHVAADRAEKATPRAARSRFMSSGSL